MAIIVEEEKKSRQGVGALITWAVVFIVLGVAVYYVFFKKPELVNDVVTPANFANTEALSQIDLQPNEVINSDRFQQLHLYTQPITTQTNGSRNPFLGNF